MSSTETSITVSAISTPTDAYFMGAVILILAVVSDSFLVKF